MKERHTLKIEVDGEDEQLSVIAYFLRQVEYVGNIGHTTSLHLWVDVDGAAGLKVRFPDLKDRLEPRMGIHQR